MKRIKKPVWNLESQQPLGKREEIGKTEESEFATTPEFQENVAKKLSAFLDSVLETEEANCLKTHEELDGPVHGGIRLLNSSKTVLIDAECGAGEGDAPMPKRRKSSSSSGSSSDEERARFASVCVSGDSILFNGEGAFKRKHSSNLKNEISISKTSVLSEKERNHKTKHRKKKTVL